MKKYFYRTCFVLNKLMIFLFIINIANLNEKKIYVNRKLYSLNQITTKIKGEGTQSILNSEYEYIPDEILVNGNPSNIVEENKITNLENEENIILMKWNNKLTSCRQMFEYLINLIEIDLTEFDSSEVKRMDYIFNGCKNLKKIIMNNNFKTPNVINMASFFAYCESLTSLDLSNFSTSLTINMAFMFENCVSIKRLNLSNFNTSLVQNMAGMFQNCKSLQSLNLSNFDTSNLMMMSYFFLNCVSLTSIDISNFNTINTNFMSSMFFNCSSLTSLDLSNFNTQNVFLFELMFYGCKQLKELNLSNFDTTAAENMEYMFSECIYLESVDISNFKIINNSILSNMFYNCNNLKFINLNNFVENPTAELNNIFDGVPDNIVICSSNEENIPNILDKLNDKICVINYCLNDWKTKLKKINEDKKECLDDCKEDNDYSYEYQNKCYNKCPEGTHLLFYIDYLCIKNCPNNYPFEKYDECINNCSAIEFFNKICKISNGTISSKEKIINTITNEIINDITNDLLINLEDNSDIIIKDKNEIYQITTSLNQINNYYNDIATINLGECENILKEIYNINEEQNLIIYKMEYLIDDFLIPIIEYEIFHPINKTKLDLNYCKNTKINIEIPVSIEEEYLYKYNPYSEYYTNECYPNILESDLIKRTNILNQRKKDFNENYLSLCEENCEYKEYNKYTKKVSCECKIKNKFSLLSEILNKKNNLLYNFKNIDEENIFYDCSIEKLFNYNCTFNNIIEEKQQIINIIRKELEKGGINKLINNFLFDKNEDLFVKQNDIIFQITSTENQKNKKYQNISIINLKQCEYRLKSHYNISQNKSLIIFKVDDMINEKKIPIVEYEIYNPDSKKNLNLTVCQDLSIEISYPISIQEDELFKYDPNSAYYNDKCFPYTTVNKTDITLNDRKREYNDKDLSLCEINCSFKNYNKETKRAECECKPKTFFEELINIKINEKKLYHKFFNFKETTNFFVIFCYKTFLSIDGIIRNIGSYIIIIVLIINVVNIGIFYKKEFKNLKEEIFKILNNTCKEKTKHFKSLKRKSKSNINLISLNINKNMEINKSSTNNDSITNKKKEINNKIKNTNTPKNNNSLRIFNRKKGKKKSKKIELNGLTDNEINSLNFEKALKYDNRTYYEYYISLLKTKHLLIFTFITRND